MRYNRKNIFREAWKILRKGVASFGLALRLAWANAKLNQIIREHEGIVEESHSFFGWKSMGFAVKHGEHAAYSVLIADPSVKGGYRKKSYFTSGQVQPIEA